MLLLKFEKSKHNIKETIPTRFYTAYTLLNLRTFFGIGVYQYSDS